MTAQRMKTLLEHHPALSKLQQGVEQTRTLKQDLAALLPAYLMPYLAVGLIRQRKLTLFVEHGTYAARLRHLAPTILEALHQRGWDVDSLRVRIRLPEDPMLSLFGRAPTAAHQKTACLSQTAWAHLARCSMQLDDSSLQHALTNMVERHRSAFSASSISNSASNSTSTEK